MWDLLACCSYEKASFDHLKKRKFHHSGIEQTPVDSVNPNKSVILSDRGEDLCQNGAVRAQRDPSFHLG